VPGAAGGKALSNLEAAVEVGKVVGGAALATGAAAAPVVGAGLVANQLYKRSGLASASASFASASIAGSASLGGTFSATTLIARKVRF
jgi:hypothetical protein